MNECSGFGQLMERIRGGDQQASDQFVQDYVPHVLTVVRRQLRTMPKLRLAWDSTDFSQVALYQLLKKLQQGNYRPETPDALVALLTKIARNAVKAM